MMSVVKTAIREVLLAGCQCEYSDVYLQYRASPSEAAQSRSTEGEKQSSDMAIGARGAQMPPLVVGPTCGQLRLGRHLVLVT